MSVNHEFSAGKAGSDGRSRVERRAGSVPRRLKSASPRRVRAWKERASARAKARTGQALSPQAASDRFTGRPIRQAPITYKSRAGHLLLANKFPVASDQPQGYWARFVVVRFGRRVTAGAKRDSKIADQILAAEHPSIIPWMLEGAARIMARNGCTLPASHHVELAEWRRNPDPIAAFVRECTSPAPEGRNTRAKALYLAYRGWAEQHRLQPVSSTRFGIRLRELRYASKRTRVGKVYALAVIVGEETERAGSFSGCADPSPRPTELAELVPALEDVVELRVEHRPHEQLSEPTAADGSSCAARTCPTSTGSFVRARSSR